MCCLRTVHANNALRPTFAGANAAELKRSPDEDKSCVQGRVDGPVLGSVHALVRRFGYLVWRQTIEVPSEAADLTKPGAYTFQIGPLARVRPVRKSPNPSAGHQPAR